MIGLVTSHEYSRSVCVRLVEAVIAVPRVPDTLLPSTNVSVGYEPDTDTDVRPLTAE